MDYLFVYGTLLSCIKHPMHQALIENASFVSKGYFLGKLFDLELYPGVVESDDPADQVTGEIYRLHNLSILEQLDEYEGYDQEYTTTSAFVRKTVTVVQENGHTLNTYIYLYNFDVSRLNRIYSGDYFLFKQNSIHYSA